jgi:tetratricopeptide (TPR) repeat protein
MAKNKWAQGILDEQLMLEVAGRPSHLTMPSHVPAAAQPAEAKGAENLGPEKHAQEAKVAAAPVGATGPESAAKGAADKSGSGERDAERVRLERAIATKPTEIKNYLELAHLLDHEGHLAEAEQVLQRALAASGNDLRVQEQLEGVQVRRARQRVATAQKQASVKPSEQAEALVAQLKEELNRLELDIYERRSRRYPEDLTLQYELGVRLKRVRNYQAAAEAFEVAQGIAGREAIAQVNRGECLQQLHKYVEALTCYADAISRAEVTPARPEDGGDEVRKLALYRAGTLAAGLKDFVNAAKYLEKLISLDPGYRDAKGRLDKIRPSGHN